MSSKCLITFDKNPLGVYYSGQLVSGAAELITTRPKTIRSISITISGYAETRWTENITKQDTHGKPQKALETYSATEFYYSNENYVYGQGGGAQLELPAGKYVFPFQTTIPPNAPTSFNGAYGYINHEVTLVIDRVMRYDNVFKQSYTVISPFDLNLNAIHKNSLQKSEEKTFCWSLFCNTNGPMVMDVKIALSAYAPGQKIRFNISLDNQSDANCNDVKVRLLKIVTYESRAPETKIQATQIKIADNHCGGVIKHNKAEFNEYLQIPATTPTSLQNCSIIKVSYTLRFIAKCFRLHGDLIIDVPFTIGTLPLYESLADLCSEGGTNEVTRFKPMPTPSHEEDQRSEQFESSTFKPRYPVFLNDITQSFNDDTKNLDPPVAPEKRDYTPNPVPIGDMKPEPAKNVARKVPTYPAAPIEVLGFSIPPDYEPTPSAPDIDTDEYTSNVGWK